jgi:hypothetical protein
MLPVVLGTWGLLAACVLGGWLTWPCCALVSLTTKTSNKKRREIAHSSAFSFTAFLSLGTITVWYGTVSLICPISLLCFLYQVLIINFSFHYTLLPDLENISNNPYVFP